MPRHADACECRDLRQKCRDVPKIFPPSGWRWDGTGTLGLWALSLMSEGRHCMLMNGDPRVWEVEAEVPGTDRRVVVISSGEERRRMSGDDCVYAVERIPGDISCR